MSKRISSNLLLNNEKKTFTTFAYTIYFDTNIRNIQMKSTIKNIYSARTIIINFNCLPTNRPLTPLIYSYILFPYETCGTKVVLVSQ